MFSGDLGFLEKDQLKISLMEMNSTVVEQILRYIYTAEIDVISIQIFALAQIKYEMSDY